MFTTLTTLVNGVNQIQIDVKDIKVTLAEHSQILTGHSQTLAEHSRKLDHLVAKTDSIAEQVIKNDVSTNARITAVEEAVENVGGKIH